MYATKMYSMLEMCILKIICNGQCTLHLKWHVKRLTTNMTYKIRIVHWIRQLVTVHLARFIFPDLEWWMFFPFISFFFSIYSKFLAMNLFILRCWMCLFRIPHFETLFSISPGNGINEFLFEHDIQWFRYLWHALHNNIRRAMLFHAT